MTFKNPFELEKQFIGLVDDICEVGKTLTQEKYHLDLAWMVFPFVEHSKLLFDFKPFYYRLLDVESYLAYP